jgi:hypothetical protein
MVSWVYFSTIIPRGRSIRGLDFDRFFHCIEPEYFTRYFVMLGFEPAPTAFETMNADACKRFLDHADNRAAREVVMEDFRRIDDISRHGTGLLVGAYERAGLNYNQEGTREQEGMRLFLENRDAFEFAWARHLFYTSKSRLTIHRVTLENFQVSQASRLDFERDLRTYFGSQAKGDRCQVRTFDDEGQTVILIAHGSYIRTVAYWEGEKIAFQSFRPAAEDIIIVDEGRSSIQIKSALAKDRKRYLQSLAANIVGNESLVEEAERSQVFTLAPIQNGQFDFAGNGEDVLDVTLLKVGMQLPTASRPTLEVRSQDIKWTFDGELGDLTLNSGELLYAKFRFRLRIPGGIARVTFELEPPDRTDLVQKKHAVIVERYLEEQGVKVA